MDREIIQLHQVHPVKLAVDISADLVGCWLMWHKHPARAVVVAHAAAVLGSVAVLRTDLSGLRSTRRGQYVLHHMPPLAEAVRYIGQLIAWTGAYRRQPVVIVLGHGVVIAGWSFGLLPAGASPGRLHPGG